MSRAQTTTHVCHVGGWEETPNSVQELANGCTKYNAIMMWSIWFGTRLALQSFNQNNIKLFSSIFFSDTEHREKNFSEQQHLKSLSFSSAWIIHLAPSLRSLLKTTWDLPLKLSCYHSLPPTNLSSPSHKMNPGRKWRDTESTHLASLTGRAGGKFCSHSHIHFTEFSNISLTLNQMCSGMHNILHLLWILQDKGSKKRNSTDLTRKECQQWYSAQSASLEQGQL